MGASAVLYRFCAPLSFFFSRIPPRGPGRCGGGATEGGSGPSIAPVPVLRMDFFPVPAFYLFPPCRFFYFNPFLGGVGVPGAAVSSKA